MYFLSPVVLRFIAVSFLCVHLRVVCTSGEGYSGIGYIQPKCQDCYRAPAFQGEAWEDLNLLFAAGNLCTAKPSLFHKTSTPRTDPTGKIHCIVSPEM